MFYFDNAATTRVSDDVKEVVNLYMTGEYGNPSSMHIAGVRASHYIDEARKKILRCIGSTDDNDSIIFTSSASEANTMAILGLAKHLRELNRKTIITSTIEHSSVLKAIDLMGHMGFDIIKIPPSPIGVIDIQKVRDLLTKDVGLLAIMAVNNEIGTVQDIKTIGELCKENNTLFFTDCVQAIGTIKIDVSDMNIDILSVSGHKFHAPKGVGALYIRNKDLLTPLIVGGGQEFGLRAGTENVPSIIGLTKAMENVYKTGVSYSNSVNIPKIKRSFINSIKKECKKNGIEFYFNGDSETNVSKIVNIRFPSVDGQSLVLLLSSMENICVSAGSACNSHETLPSHVLTEIGLNEEEALSSIRISFSKYNTIDEAEFVAKKIVECVSILLKQEV